MTGNETDAAPELKLKLSADDLSLTPLDHREMQDILSALHFLEVDALQELASLSDAVRRHANSCLSSVSESARTSAHALTVGKQASSELLWLVRSGKSIEGEGLLQHLPSCIDATQQAAEAIVDYDKQSKDVATRLPGASEVFPRLSKLAHKLALASSTLQSSCPRIAELTSRELITTLAEGSAGAVPLLAACPASASVDARVSELNGVLRQIPLPEWSRPAPAAPPAVSHQVKAPPPARSGTMQVQRRADRGEQAPKRARSPVSSPVAGVPTVQKQPAPVVRRYQDEGSPRAHPSSSVSTQNDDDNLGGCSRLSLRNLFGLLND